MKKAQKVNDILFKKIPWYSWIVILCGFSLIIYLSDYTIHLPIRPISSQYMNVFVYSDSLEGGNSSILQQKNNTEELLFSTFLGENHTNPHVGFGIYIDTTGIQNGIDCSRFNSLSFEMRTLQAVPQMVQIGMKDWEGIDDVRPFRLTIETNTKWKKYDITFDRFKTPDWWTMKHNVLSTNEKNLKQVKTICFENNNKNLISKKQLLYIKNISFEGKDYTKLWWYLSACGIVSILLLISIYTQHLSSLRKQRKTKRKKETKQQIDTRGLIDNQPSDWDVLEKFLLENYTRHDLKMESVQETLGWNSKKVNTVLKNATGNTFRTFLNEMRIDAACKLLDSNTEDSISQIGYLVGFESPSHFNRVFKSQIGKPPGDYRKTK